MERNGLSIVEAKPVTATVNMRNQKCLVLGMFEK